MNEIKRLKANLEELEKVIMLFENYTYHEQIGHLTRDYFVFMEADLHECGSPALLNIELPEGRE